MTKILIFSGRELEPIQMKKVTFIDKNGEEIECCVGEEIYNQLKEEYGDME